MATPGVMKDSYIGGIATSSFIKQSDEPPFCVSSSKEQEQKTDEIARKKIRAIGFCGKTIGWEGKNETDEDKIVHLTCADKTNSTNINKTEEYNVHYSGLSILPWEEFVFNPRVFNDLFYAESNKKITFDPDEVNVFFHGKNVMPPTFGDISENGKSWYIDVADIHDLRRIRKLLTERCSVFGVTLQYKEKRFAKTVRAPCLVLVDPNQDEIGDRLYTTLTRAMDTFHNQRRFCVEINLNVCVERWCRRVLLTECKAVGAKLVVTNGEEYTHFNGTEDAVCCVVCFPVWLLQTGIYKLHRNVTYDDYKVDFHADEMFLHGSFQDVQYQRQQIFKEFGDVEVFRTRSAAQTDVETLQALGTYKFVCVKKVDKSEADDKITEYNTATFGVLVDKRKERVLLKDKKMSEKNISRHSHSCKIKERHKQQNVTLELEGNEHAICIVHRKQDPLKTINTSPNRFVNEGFSSSDNESDISENEETPRIPEIASILCVDDQDETVEMDISPDFEMRCKNGFFKTADSLDQVSFNYSTKRLVQPDSKSMTAVCSFEVFDAESELESDTTDESEPDKIYLMSSKEILLEEMLKIEQSLPSIQDGNRIKDGQNMTTDETPEEDKKLQKANSKQKVKIGKAVKDLTKTTERSAKYLPSEMKTKIKLEKETKNTPPGNDDTKDHISNQTHVTGGSYIEESVSSADPYKTQDKQTDSTVLGQAKVHAKKDKSDERQMDVKSSRSDILHSNRSLSKVQENNTLAFSPHDSSSDGDEVEMIYQSQKSKYASTNVEVVFDEEDPRRKPSEAISILNIDHVVHGNRQRVCNEKSKYQKENIKENDDNDEKLEDNIPVCENNVVCDVINASESNAACGVLTTRQASFGITMVETALDVTDIDDVADDFNTGKPKVNIPPLKLNIGETLGKKMKRGRRQYSSNRKYLGASVPTKIKKRP